MPPCKTTSLVQARDLLARWWTIHFHKEAKVAFCFRIDINAVTQNTTGKNLLVTMSITIDKLNHDEKD
jgi:hypothetical protein